MGVQIDDLDGDVAAFQATAVGLDGDNPVVRLPTIVRDMERIDRAWPASARESDRTCPPARAEGAS